MYNYGQITVITCHTMFMIMNKWKFDSIKLNSRIRESPVRLTVTLYVLLLPCLKFPHQSVILLPAHSRSLGHSSCCYCWLCNKMSDNIATQCRLLVICIKYDYNSYTRINLNVHNTYGKQDLLGPPRTLKMKALHFFDSSVKNNPASRRQKPFDINPQHHHCVNIKSHTPSHPVITNLAFRFTDLGFIVLDRHEHSCNILAKIRKKCLLRGLAVDVRILLK